MTVAVEPYRPLDAVAQLRLVLAGEGGPEWWLRLSEALDALRAHLARSDVSGIADQVLADAPELAAAATRLPRMRQAVKAEATRLRLRIDRVGLREDVRDVRASASALAQHVRRLERSAEDLLHDAYQRDFGGE
jgi:hypothetical protein